MISEELKDAMGNIEERFVFLYTGHWLQGNLGQDRKDTGMLVKTFLETFKNKPSPPALLMKTSGATFSVIDRNEIQEKIDDIKATVKGKLPPVYFLHGNLTDEEMNQMYNHVKVKAHITFTHGEGFGRPLLEASLSEKIVIAIIWIAIALSSLLSIKEMFQNDFEDGTLDFYMLSAATLETIICLKAFTHWITTNLPIIFLIPLISIPLGITFYHSILISLVMLVSTPALSFISTLGAALTLGEKGGNLLLSIFILPTFLPIIIFGMKISILITNSIYDIMAHLILFALSLICLAITPFITSAIIKVHYS